ncbi:hypothetical protein D3C77_303500 [compost metagenome]
MPPPDMKTKRSLIVNGQFTEPYDRHWQLDDGTVLQEHDGEVHYLYLSYGIVKQSFDLPVDPQKSTYTLSVHYQPSQFSPPKVHPYVELWAPSTDQCEKIELIGASDGFAFHMPLTKGMPWLERSEDFKLFGPNETAFELRFASGHNPETPPVGASGDWPWREGAMHFTNVDVQLILQPLLLEERVPEITMGDRQARFLVDGKVPFCRGKDTKHSLKLPIDPECGWGKDDKYDGSHVYAYWQDAEEASRLKVELLPPEPEEDGTRLVSKAFEVVSGNADNGDLQIVLQSIYDAAPYILPCVVGHFMLDDAGAEQPEYWPVFPQGEPIELALHLKNAKTKGPADGVAVTWIKADESTETVLTDQEGWARYEYRPIKAEDHAVTATFNAPYNLAVGQHLFNVRTIPTEPWQQFAILFDGQPVDMTKGFLLLTLGKVHQLQLKPSAACVLVGEEIKLNWEMEGGESPEEFEVTPALGASGELTESGFAWDIKCVANFERRIAINLQCKRFSRPLDFALTLLGIGSMYIASPTQQQEALKDPTKIIENKLFYVL